jgi:hypothetical protein
MSRGAGRELHGLLVLLELLAGAAAASCQGLLKPLGKRDQLLHL